MPVGNEGIVCGSYVCTLGGVAMGIFVGEEQVPTIRERPKSRSINSSDKYGQTKIDSIRMGKDYVFSGTLHEYAKAKTVFLDQLETWGRLGTIGTLKFLSAGALVLTAVAGTTASASPATLTAGKAVKADDFEVQIFYGPQERIVPIMYDLLPYDVGGGVVGFFVET